MPNLSSLLQQIPDEFKPLAALGIGALVLVILVLFHGLSLHRILVQHQRGEARLRSTRPHLFTAEFFFGWSIFLMLGLHITEITVWAFVLAHMGLAPHPLDALYFCANAYTTLGYGNVDLGQQWHLISPIIAISGLFTFAWTTSSLVSIVSNHVKLLQQLEAERLKEKEMRFELRTTARQLRRQEQDAQLASRLESAKDSGKVSFAERYRLWRQERRKERQMRIEVRNNLEELRREERTAEEKLGEEIQSESWSDSQGKK